MYGVVWVSLIWMYFTEVRGTQVMGDSAPASPSFTLAHQGAGTFVPGAVRSSSSEGIPASLDTALGRA
jgi:hypothetical protein